MGWLLGRNRYVKRALDIVGASAGLILLSPLLVAVAGVVRVTQGAPIIFRQPRPGLNCRVFLLYKFRTMSMATSADGEPLPVASRLTSLGRVLRRASVDELPELWNVLRGEMSLVGPRPLLVEYLPLYSPQEARRHEVKPGMTGLAQVSGRNTLEWNDRFALDVRYVDEWTVGLDLRILWKTLSKVTKMEGISGIRGETMEPFRGGDSQATRSS